MLYLLTLNILSILLLFVYCRIQFNHLSYLIDVISTSEQLINMRLFRIYNRLYHLDEVDIPDFLKQKGVN